MRERNTGVFRTILLFFGSLMFLLPLGVQAAPNGLTQIPIAKVFGDGVAAFSIARGAGQQIHLLHNAVWDRQRGVSRRGLSGCPGRADHVSLKLQGAAGAQSGPAAGYCCGSAKCRHRTKSRSLSGRYDAASRDRLHAGPDPSQRRSLLQSGYSLGGIS